MRSGVPEGLCAASTREAPGNPRGGMFSSLASPLADFRRTTEPSC